MNTPTDHLNNAPIEEAVIEIRVTPQEGRKVEELGDLCRAATNRHGALEDQLFSIIEECRVAGWDGYGAQPISPMALTEARQLLAVISQPPVAA